MDVKTTFRNLVRDQSVSICMLQSHDTIPVQKFPVNSPVACSFFYTVWNPAVDAEE
jgi:hypothetical protein